MRRLFIDFLWLKDVVCAMLNMRYKARPMYRIVCAVRKCPEANEDFHDHEASDDDVG
jgi:cytochrome c oxidase assembly protein Cox11